MTFPVQTPVQGSGSLGATTTFSLALPAFGASVTPGNTVAVSMALNTGGGGTTQTIVVTDDKSNVYTIGPASIGYFDPFTGGIIATAYALNVTNGPKTITVTASDSVSGSIRIGAAAYEVPGAVTVDVNSNVIQSATTAINVAFTTITAVEYAIISAASSAGLTLTSENNGWTEEQAYGGIGTYQLYNTLASTSASWQATSSASTHMATAILTFAPSAPPSSPTMYFLESTEYF